MADQHDKKTDPTRDPEKTVDLPPYGPRNPDPITNAPGSHPIETGIGAAIGGAASGLAVGTLTAEGVEQTRQALHDERTPLPDAP